MNALSIFASITALATPLVASSTIIQISFTTPGNTPVAYDGSTWNRVNGQTRLKQAQSLVDASNVPTEITLTSSTAMRYAYDQGQRFMRLPEAVSNNVLFGHDKESANPSFTFSGLNTHSTYTFRVYALRRGHTDIRSGRYTATGENTRSEVVNASNNTNEVLILTDIIPDATGSIVFSLMKDVTNNSHNAANTTSGYFYISALVIEVAEATIPVPSTYAFTAKPAPDTASR